MIGDSNLTRAHSAEAGEAICTSIARAIDRVGAEVDLLKLFVKGSNGIFSKMVRRCGEFAT
jgi:hypothetical protein